MQTRAPRSLLCLLLLGCNAAKDSGAVGSGNPGVGLVPTTTGSGTTGSGTTTPAGTPTLTTTGTSSTSAAWIDIAAGSGFTCGLRSNGIAECWGNQLVRSAGSPPGTPFVAIEASESAACGLTAAGSIDCWFCAFDTFDGCDQPWGLGITHLRGGAGGYCGLLPDGSLQCTGMLEPENLDLLPPQTAGSFDLEGECVCGLDGQTGELTCLGPHCQSGINQPPQPTWQMVALGYLNACGLDDQGMATCWGETSVPGELFPQPPSPGPYSQIEAMQQFVCALDLAGFATCWAAPGTPATFGTPPPAVALVDISVGLHHACGITATGDAHCWGVDYDGCAVVPP